MIHPYALQQFRATATSADRNRLVRHGRAAKKRTAAQEEHQILLPRRAVIPLAQLVYHSKTFVDEPKKTGGVADQKCDQARARPPVSSSYG